MKTLQDILTEYNLELSDKNEIIIIREFNLDETAFQKTEDINVLSNVLVSVCTYPEERQDYSYEVIMADFFFNIDDLSTKDIEDTIEIILHT